MNHTIDKREEFSISTWRRVTTSLFATQKSAEENREWTELPTELFNHDIFSLVRFNCLRWAAIVWLKLNDSHCGEISHDRSNSQLFCRNKKESSIENNFNFNFFPTTAAVAASSEKYERAQRVDWSEALGHTVMRSRSASLYPTFFFTFFSCCTRFFSSNKQHTYDRAKIWDFSFFFLFLPSPSHYVWFHFIFAISSPWQRSVCTIKKKASKTIARIEFPPFFAACPLSDGNFTSSLFFCRQDDVRDFFIPIQFSAEEWSLSRYHQTTMIHSVELLEYSYFHWVFFLCNRLNDTTSAVVTYIAALETSKYWRDVFSSFLHSICTTLSRGMNIVFCTFHSLLLTSPSQRPMLN